MHSYHSRLRLIATSPTAITKGNEKLSRHLRWMDLWQMIGGDVICTHKLSNRADGIQLRLPAQGTIFTFTLSATGHNISCLSCVSESSQTLAVTLVVIHWLQGQSLVALVENLITTSGNAVDWLREPMPFWKHCVLYIVVVWITQLIVSF